MINCKIDIPARNACDQQSHQEFQAMCIPFATRITLVTWRQNCQDNPVKTCRSCRYLATASIKTAAQDPVQGGSRLFFWLYFALRLEACVCGKIQRPSGVGETVFRAGPTDPSPHCCGTTVEGVAAHGGSSTKHPPAVRPRGAEHRWQSSLRPVQYREKHPWVGRFYNVHPCDEVLGKFG